MADVNQSKVELLFSTPILIHHWNDSEVLNEQLRTIILEREQASAGQSKSNVGGWQSTDDLASWAGAAGGEVVQRVMATVNHATRQLMIDAKGRVEFGWKFAIWANVNRRGQYNRMHFHPGSTWSGTYYVDVGDSPSATNPLAGSLEIMSPNQASAMSFLSGLLPHIQNRPTAIGHDDRLSELPSPHRASLRWRTTAHLHRLQCPQGSLPLVDRI